MHIAIKCVTNSSSLFPPKLFIKKLNTQILSKCFALKFARELSKGWFWGWRGNIEKRFGSNVRKGFCHIVGFYGFAHAQNFANSNRINSSNSNNNISKNNNGCNLR